MGFTRLSGFELGVPPCWRAYFLLLRQKKVAKEKATPGYAVGYANFPALLETGGGCGTRATPSDSPRPLSAAFSVARRFARGPKSSRLSPLLTKQVGIQCPHTISTGGRNMPIALNRIQQCAFAVSIACLTTSYANAQYVPAQTRTEVANPLVKLSSHYDPQRRATVDFYLDKNRVTSDGNLRRVWVLLNFDRLQEEHIGYRYFSLLQQEEIHCFNAGWRRIEQLVFSGQMGSGQLIKRNLPRPKLTSRSTTTFNAAATQNQVAGQIATNNYETGSDAFTPIPPNSLLDKVYQRVCR